MDRLYSKAAKLLKNLQLTKNFTVVHLRRCDIINFKDWLDTFYKKNKNYFCGVTKGIITVHKYNDNYLNKHTLKFGWSYT